MSNWREKLAQLMQGRYGGNDTLNKWLLAAFLILLILAIILQSNVLNLLSIALLAYAYFRIFSRNTAKRMEENRKFVEGKQKLFDFFPGGKTSSRDHTHRVFCCPQCKQKVRVPKGHGKIAITCPKCHHKFIRRS